MPDPQSISMNEDERMIPIWSIIAASLAFVLVEYYFWIIAPAQRHHAPPPLGLRIYFNLSWGVVASLYIPHGRLHQQGRAAPRHEHAFLDVYLFRDARRTSAPCFTSCCASPRFPAALLAEPMCRATSTSVPSATTSLRPTAATASAPCAPPISSARAAAMNWPPTTRRRACA